MEGARAPAAIAAVTTCNAIEVAVSCCWHHGHYGCAHAAKAGAGWSEAVAGAGVGWSSADGGWCGDIDMGERAGGDGTRRVLRRRPCQAPPNVGRQRFLRLWQRPGGRRVGRA